jgi:ATP-dependent helicase/nuclease subunit B
MIPARPRAFSIPVGCAFLPTLAEELLAGRIIEGFPRSPADLAEATIFLPTRRAARALTDILAQSGDGTARLLPRIVPLGEADDAALEVAAAASPFEGAELLAPPIPPLARRLILARLVRQWSATVDGELLRFDEGVPFMVPSSPADAVSLAADLETLMDAFATEEVDWSRIGDAVDSEFSRYFEITLAFVRIAHEAWPAFLAERKASDPTLRRNTLIAAEARRLLRDRPTAPIIAAGSTGSVLATAALLAAIARLPNGAVVLPGLDLDLDPESWELIGGAEGGREPAHSHPQAMMRRLLAEYLRVGREGIDVLGRPSARAVARGKVLSEALRPAETTERWAEFDRNLRIELAVTGTERIAIVEAADEREEALASAIALREAVLTPGRRAALITPDRSLAVRTAAELQRWGIVAEDSAGTPLSEMPAGRLARLAAEAAALEFHPVRLLALLAHPFVRLGWTREMLDRAAAALEIGVFRGPAPGRGLPGLREALEGRRAETGRMPRPQRLLAPEDWDVAAELVERLSAAFAPLDIVGEVDLVGLAVQHGAVVASLCEGPEPPDDASLDALMALFDDLAESGTHGFTGHLADYKDFFATLAAERVVPSAGSRQPQVQILGPLEARLLSFDRVVLGGLDEGIWPPRTQTDAFLNRPMRAQIGLSPPERRIGQSAHDFVQALGADDIVVTRAKKRNGSPMVPSRFLQRLRAFAGDEAWTRMTDAGSRWLGYARWLEHPDPAPACARPAPKPPPALIPRSLSVTEIETLVRDPYAIFARHVLKLDPLDRVAAPPGMAERGFVFRDLLARFVHTFPQGLPATETARAFLIEAGEAAFARIRQRSPRLHAEWWPRFCRTVEAFLDFEAERRPGLAAIAVETPGALRLSLKDGSTFTLRARASRIETSRNGEIAILDFRTGLPPSDKTVFAGFSPQLTLQAAMLRRGGFSEIGKAGVVPTLEYVRLGATRDPFEPSRLKPPKGDVRSLEELSDEHLSRLIALIDRYVTQEAGFLSRPFPQYARAVSDYDHLARVGEWSATSAGGFEESPE